MLGFIKCGKMEIVGLYKKIQKDGLCREYCRKKARALSENKKKHMGKACKVMLIRRGRVMVDGFLFLSQRSRLVVATK